jgi:uncharacterized protein YndB with AHSA1/START domain
MKWLRRLAIVILAVPVLGLGLLLVAGSRADAGRNEAQVEVAAPRAAVFRYLAEPDLVKVWSDARFELVGSGPLQAGSRARLTLPAEPRAIELEAEATAVEPDRHLALALKTRPGSGTPFSQLVHYRLTDVAGGTRLAVTVDTLYESALVRLLEPLITPAAQKRLTSQMTRLEKAIEAGPMPEDASK